MGDLRRQTRAHIARAHVDIDTAAVRDPHVGGGAEPRAAANDPSRNRRRSWPSRQPAFSGNCLFLFQTWLVARIATWVARRCGVVEDGGVFGSVVALFAALHPATAETLNYVIARSDTSTAGIASLALWQRVPKSRAWGLHALPAAVGVFAKAPAAMYAPILLMHVLLVDEGIPLTRLWKRRVGRGTRGTCRAPRVPALRRSGCIHGIDARDGDELGRALARGQVLKR